MKKLIVILMALALAVTAAAAIAESSTETAADGMTARGGRFGQPGQMPPMPNGQVPQMPDGQAPANSQAPQAEDGQSQDNGQAQDSQVPDNSQAPDSITQATQLPPVPGNGSQPAGGMHGRNGKGGMNNRNGKGRMGGNRHGTLDTEALVTKGTISRETADKISAYAAGHVSGSLLKEMLDAGVITQEEYAALLAEEILQQTTAPANNETPADAAAPADSAAPAESAPADAAVPSGTTVPAEPAPAG